MGSNITPNEIVSVMKEKELCYLNYNLPELGSTYDSIMTFFKEIYGKITDIKGLNEIVQSLPEDKKEILYSKCEDLIDSYNSETDIEKKMDLLEEMSLIMNPELKQKYPLIDSQVKKR